MKLKSFVVVVPFDNQILFRVHGRDKAHAIERLPILRGTGLAENEVLLTWEEWHEDRKTMAECMRDFSFIDSTFNH